jgi:hypothetical protein
MIATVVVGVAIIAIGAAFAFVMWRIIHDIRDE